MSFFWITFISIHALSAIFFVISVMLYVNYRKKNHFIESHRTLLLGFIRLEHVVFAYGVSVAVFTVGSFFLVIYLL